MLIWTSPSAVIIFASKAKGVQDERKDSIEPMLLDMRKKGEGGDKREKIGQIYLPTKRCQL